MRVPAGEDRPVSPDRGRTAEGHALSKGPEAFRTISEVAEELDLPQHVLRFWETRFNQIRPMKRGGGRRYYRPDDVDLLRGIRRLLYGEGYTIKGVQRILKEQGLRHVAAFGQDGTLDPVPRGADLDEDEAADAVEVEREVHGRAPAPSERREPVFEPRHTPPSPVRAAPPAVRHGAERHGPEPVPSVSNFPAAPPDEPEDLETYLPPLVSPGPGVPDRKVAAPREADPFRPLRAEERHDPQFAVEGRAGTADTQPAAPAVARLSGDDIRLLQTALAELLELKRMLDQAR